MKHPEPNSALAGVLTESFTPLKEVEIESIRKKLAGAADTGYRM